MNQCISVEPLGFLELLCFELEISIILHSESDSDQLRVTHHPSCGLPIVNLNDFHCEYQSGIPWNLRRGTDLSISVLRFDDNFCFLAQLHGANAYIPALYHLTSPNVELECLTPIARSIKHRAVLKSPLIVDRDLLALLWQCTLLVTERVYALDDPRVLGEVNLIEPLG